MGNISPFLNQHCEGLLVGFEDLDLEVVGEGQIVRLAPVRVHQVLEEGRLGSDLLGLAVELANVLLRPAVHVLSSLAIVAGTFEVGDVGWPSSPQAE